MNKPIRSKTSHQRFANARLRQAHVDPPAANPGPANRQTGATAWLVACFILLQVITLVAALTVAWSPNPAPPPPDAVDALNVSPAVEPQPALPEPPPPTPMAQQSAAEPSPPSPPAPAAAVKFRGVEITQGIQVFQEPEDPRCQPDPTHPDNIFCNNSMPMVAGRHTLVRAYLACNGTCPTPDVTVRLRLLKDGQVQESLTRRLPVDTLQRVANMPMLDVRLGLENSVNFELMPPPEWLSGPVTFALEAVAQPQAETAPATLSLTKDFVVRKPLRIAYLPIEYQGLRPPDPLDADYWLLRMYPVSEVEYYRLPMPDLTWDGDVGKSQVLRKLLYTYWFYAQYHPTQNRPDQLFGWLPQELYNGGASDPYWCPNCAGPHSSRVAFGGLRPEQDIGGPRILVHEIAHNLGAQHAWSPTSAEDAGCFKAEGVDIRVDPTWPYAQTPYIQEVGIDLYSTPPVIYPPSYYDMMAYCTRPWISPHTYRKIFESPFLQPHVTELLSFTNYQPQVESTDNGTLLISGVVYPNGSVSAPEVISLEGNAFASSFSPPLEFTPPPGDDYCLNVQAGDDTMLAQHCFDVGFMDLETGQATEPSPFFFTLPQVDAGAVKKVTVTKNQVAVVIVTPSNARPQVNVTFPNGGEVLSGSQTFTWEATDADGDRLRYDVLYSPDGGQSWVPLAVQLTQTSYTFHTGQVTPGKNALIRVIANDGFHTVTDESDATFTIEPPPENSISLRGPAAVSPGQTFEITVTANRVTRPGLFGAQFELEFDPGMVQVDNVRVHPNLELVVKNTIQNEVGRVLVVASRQGQVDNLTGQIALATLTLTAGQNQGQLNFDLHNVAAGARGGIPMTISDIQGLSLRVVP